MTPLLQLLGFTLFVSMLPSTWADTISDDVIEITLDQLHPTQPSVGYDQIYYKLGRYHDDREKMFDEICEANGQKGVSRFYPESQPSVADSFSCQAAVASQKEAMKTVVIAPNNQYYLTDGHHTFNAFYDMPGGGKSFKIHVLIEHDYRNLTSMSDFWQAMIHDGNTWLYDQTGKALLPMDLPSALSLTNFANDPYRSMIYFTKKIAWDKPEHPIPFLEFYWTKELGKEVNLDQYDLSTRQGYQHAVEDASHALLTIQTDDVAGSGYSSQSMGLYSQFNKKKFKKLIKDRGKIDYMIRYKSVLNTQ